MSFGKFPVLLALFILFAVSQEQALAIKKTYIVYLGAHSHGPEVASDDLTRVTESHIELLSSFVGSKEKAKDAIIYSYDTYINGFAALLEDEEAAEIAKHPDVVSVFRDQGKKLHTTHSWDFLRLENDGAISSSSLWEKAKFGEDTIIANLDTGVWPESKSFSGDGFGPIPSKWKGVCQFHEPLCNRKLIGVRYYNKAFAAFAGTLNSTYETPRDTEGHGSHTLSTAGGNFVPRASILGSATGTAKGGSPKARVASYKVCWPPINDSECFDADIMKGFDAAIHDGVDVVSVSLGGAAADYFNDGIAIGAFHAVKKGMVVVASAGNEGPYEATVTNVAPWIITVGATTLDREFQANVKLGNGSVLKGSSLSIPLPQNKFYPLISAAHAAAANVSAEDAILCQPNTLDPKKVKHKIVVCQRGLNPRVEKGMVAARAGGAGMILCNDQVDGNELIADPHFLPATQVNYTDGLTVFAYVNNTKNPQGFITPPKAMFDVKPAPMMASFSSRGPNLVTQEILKPDIAAPGVNIIAAYSEDASPTDLDIDKRSTAYNILSGTSMACPHVAGVVGLLKSLHPDWSQAAIRSAIMTTARTRDNTMNAMRDEVSIKSTPLGYGAGNIRPNRAMDPGLVYDLSMSDYLDFLCGLGYNESLLRQFSGSHHDCPSEYSLLDFNYPSISAPNIYGSVTLTRVLKNVGKPGTYASRVRSPPGFPISVEPKILTFEKVGEEKMFKVNVKVDRASRQYQFGQLTWSDGTHYVRSPIVVASAP